MKELYNESSYIQPCDIGQDAYIPYWEEDKGELPNP